MNTDPRQFDPEFQGPDAAGTERASQFGTQSQADSAQGGAARAWAQSDVIPSTPVFGSDDKKVGTVQESYYDSFLVKSGFFFVHDYYIPYDAIARADAERIVLRMTSDEARHQEAWHQPPQTRATSDASAEGDLYQRPHGVYGPQGEHDTAQSASERGMPAEQEPTKWNPDQQPPDANALDNP